MALEDMSQQGKPDAGDTEQKRCSMGENWRMIRTAADREERYYLTYLFIVRLVLLLAIPLSCCIIAPIMAFIENGFTWETFIAVFLLLIVGKIGFDGCRSLEPRECFHRYQNAVEERESTASSRSSWRLSFGDWLKASLALAFLTTVLRERLRDRK